MLHNAAEIQRHLDSCHLYLTAFDLHVEGKYDEARALAATADQDEREPDA